MYSSTTTERDNDGMNEGDFVGVRAVEAGGENPTVEQVRKRAKWDNDDYVCRGLILNAKYMVEDASSKKFFVSNFTNYKTTDSRPVLEQYNKLIGILGRFTQHKMNMDESIQVSCIIDKLPPSWKDFKHTLKHLNEELTLIELGNHLHIEESLRVQDSDKPKGNNVIGPSVVNTVEHNNSSRYNGNKGKRKHHDTRANPNKKPKVTCWKYGKPGHLIKDCKASNIGNRANGSSTKGSEDGSSNPLKDQSMFNKSHQIYYVTYVSEAFFVHDDDVAWWVDSGATVHVCKDRCWFKTYESLNDGSILHMENESTTLGHGHGCVKLRLDHVYFKRMQDMSKDGLIPTIDMDTEKWNKRYFVTFIDDASRFCNVHLLHSKDEALDKFKYVGIIHETTAPYTLQQNGISERKNRVLKEMVNSMLSYFGLSQGFWGEAMLTACYLLNRVPNKWNRTTPYELWTKKKPNLNYLRVWGCRTAVRLPDPKLKTVGERGIECIFVTYAEYSKAFRFYVIKPNDSVAINSIIDSRDAMFDEHMFSSVPRPSQRSMVKRTKDSGGSVVYERVIDQIVHQSEPQLRKRKMHKTPKDFEHEFQLYLIEGTRDEVSDQHSYCFNVEDNPKTFDEAMKPLGCKWIFKRKLKVDGTVEKFKARLVIQGFKQKSGTDYFDTYAEVARISTIRLLIAMESIHNMIIHQMNVKTNFLNGELEEEVYMNQPLGFIMPGNENKVCKLIKSMYGLKQAPKQRHQNFDEVILSNGYLLNQAYKCVYSKFNASGKGVIICLYVDDMLIFSTDQVWVDLTKEFLSLRFSMKNMGEADVILGIRIKHGSNVSTPLDTCEKLIPNRGLVVSQLEYSRVIGYLMYAMTSTRPDIVFVMGKLSRYTSNPGTQHWQAIQRVLNNTEDNLSTSGWVFLLGGGAISWASKKQTCITGSTMKSEFVAVAVASKEAEWLKNFLLEISLWVKPIAPIFIHCDSVATLAKAYSQMYSGKSRHLGVRHSMICELITNVVVSIEFVRSQQNLVDHLTKGLARDLVIKSAEGMRLKSN
nr:zinc finger, CCHC-type [Tanacetum cinerariifolium]